MELIRHNIDAVGLSQHTSKLLANLVQKRVTLEKSLRRNLLGRAEDLNASIWAVEDYQRDFVDSVLETGVDQFYSLGVTLQATEPLSASFQIEPSTCCFTVIR